MVDYLDLASSMKMVMINEKMLYIAHVNFNEFSDPMIKISYFT